MKENRKFTIDIGVNAGQVSSTIKSLTRELVDLKETGKQAGNLIQNQRQLIKNRSNLEANLKNAEKVYNDTLAKYASYNLNGRDFAKELQNIKVKYDPIKNIRNVGKKNFSKIREELSDRLYFEIFGGNYDFDYKGKKKLAESIYSFGGKYNGNFINGISKKNSTDILQKLEDYALQGIGSPTAKEAEKFLDSFFSFNNARTLDGSTVQDVFKQRKTELRDNLKNIERDKKASEKLQTLQNNWIKAEDEYNKFVLSNANLGTTAKLSASDLQKLKDETVNFINGNNLDESRYRVLREELFNKREIDALNDKYVTVGKIGQQYFDYLGVKNFNLFRTHSNEIENILRNNGIAESEIPAHVDFFNLLASKVIDPYKAINTDVQTARNRLAGIERFGSFNDIINNSKSELGKVTSKREQIGKYIENFNNVRNVQSDILTALNKYDLGLSKDFTDETFNSILNNVVKGNEKYTEQDIENIQKLKDLYRQSESVSSDYNNTIQKSELLVEEKIIGKNIKEITKDFNNLNNSFDDLSQNKEYKRLTSKKNFLENIFGRNQKISKNLKEDLNNRVNLQDIHLKRLANIAEQRYGIKLYGDYSKENFQKAFTLAQNNKEGIGESFSKKQLRNIGNIQQALTTTYNERQQINSLLTADQQQREEEREEAVKTQQFIHNMNALSQAAHRIGAGAWQGVMYGKGSVDEYVKYQSSVVGIAKLLPALRDQKTLIVNNKFKDFREGILNLTNRLPSSGIELAHSAEVAARLGVTNPDRILDMVDLSAKLGATFGMNPDDVTQQIVKIANGMGYNFSDPNIKKKILDNIADPINYLDDHTAASGREILNFTKKSVSIGKQVGMETRDVAAFGATLISLGITSDSAATAFKNLITVMQTGARNQKKGKEYLEKAGFTQQQLMEGMKKAPTTTALKFLQQLNKLKSGKAGEDAASIARFGFGQMSLPGILALVNNPKRLEEYLAMARSGALNWTEIEYKAKEVNDPAIRFATMQNKYKELQITLGEALMPLADDLIIFLKKTSNDLIPAIKKNKELLQGLGIGAIGTAGIANTTAFIADASIIMANLPLLSKIAKPFAIIAGELLAGALIFQGVRQKIVEPIVYKGMIKEEHAKNKAEEKTKGTIKDNTRRSQSQHGEIYTEKKYTDLVHRLNKKGYDAFINEDGQVQISKIKYKKNTIGQKEKIKGKPLHFIKDFDNFTGERRYLTSNGWYIDVSEEQAPELFSIIDQIKREHGRLRSVRARNNILPKGVQRKSKYGTQDRVFASLTGEELPVSIGNLPDYNHMVDKITEERNNRIRKAQVTDSKIQKVKKAKEELDLIESKKEKDGYELFRARENLDIAKQELAQAEKDERKTKQHENKLIKDINGIPWQTPNAYRSYYDLDKNNKPNKKTPIEIKKQDDEKTKQRYLDFVKAQGFDSIESYNVEVQQRMVDYLSKQHQALKVFAGESNDPKLNKYKDLNAYYDPSINPYGYYGIERTAELLNKAKQKLEEYKKAYNDFQKDNPNNPLSDFFMPENPWQNLFASPQEDTDKSINNNFGKLNNFLKIDAETKEGLVTVNKNTEKVQTSLKGINEAMPSIVANFDSWGKTDSSLALIDAHTSSILKNLQGINSIKDLTISIGIDLGQNKHSKEQK